MSVFDFSEMPRPRGSYVATLESLRCGLLSIGLVWELAKHDEVFAAYLRKQGVMQA